MRQIWMTGSILACALALAAPTATEAAPTPPAWLITAVASPTHLIPGDTEGNQTYILSATNTGDEPTDGSAITVADELPTTQGITLHEATISGRDAFTGAEMTCSPSPLGCTYSGVVMPGDELTVVITVDVSSSAPASVVNRAAVSGGGGASSSTEAHTVVSSEPVGFGVASHTVALSTAQAGGHPNFTTQFSLGQNPLDTPASSMKDVTVELPPGLAGDPLSTHQCDMNSVITSTCPQDTAVGVATTMLDGTFPVTALVYNIAPYEDEPAAFAFNVIGLPFRMDTSVIRRDGEYAVQAQLQDASEQLPVTGASVTLWGVPAENNGPEGPGSFIDYATGQLVRFGGRGGDVAVPLLSNPSACGRSSSLGISVDSWADPVAPEPELLATEPMTGCEELSFEPSISVLPDSFAASAPAGYRIGLHVPQSLDAGGLSTPDLKTAVVGLPVGTVISPSSTNGLEGCSDGQFDLRSLTPASCPKASQIGTAQITTPLLAAPLKGRLFLAAPACGPCTPLDAQDGRMVRLFLEAQGSGVIIKLAGTTSVDQSTGQLTATFDENPQLPFEDLRITLAGGPGAPLANPSTCGVQLRANAQLTPFSSETPAEPWSEPFQVSGCSSPRFSPSFGAGTINNQAGAFSPETVTFSRTDADEDLQGITVRTPPGLLGMLSRVQLCPQAQAQAGTCEAQSQIGTTTVGAGPGPSPFFLGGKVFLTGPYKGAPFGLSIVVPALAGPFNLGTVVVRAAISVDPSTSALTIASDPLPQSLDGIPLQIKTVNVNIDREGFVFNPTNCQPMAVGAILASTRGTSAAVASRFQAANCARLPFKPKLTALTEARTSRTSGAYLHVKVTSGPGQANIAKVRVDLPRQLPSRLSTLQKACPESTFNANPASCPAASVVGSAIAATPVLKGPLSGPAYLVSHGGAAFPDLEIVLQGEGITLVLDGSTEIRKGITISSFNTVPDAPISSFDLVLPVGPHSVLAAYLPAKANGSMCGQSLSMPTMITGQNGGLIRQTTRIAVSGCPRHRARRAR